MSELMPWMWAESYQRLGADSRGDSPEVGVLIHWARGGFASCHQQCPCERILNRAGWHTTTDLDVPENITPIFLPSRAPELNPVENIWQYLRANWLSNRVFENYHGIIEAICDAWQRLIAKPETITSIGMRQWAHIGHTQ